MKSSQGLVKSVIGCWTRLGPLWFTPRNCRSVQGVQGPQKTYFQACIIHSHGPTGFGVGEAKEMLLVEKGKELWQRNIFIISFWWFFWGRREDEDKRRHKNGQIWLLSFQNFPFWTHTHTHTQKSTYSLFGAWSFLLAHIWFKRLNLVRGPKAS